MNLYILPIYKRRLNPGLPRLLKKLVLRPKSRIRPLSHSQPPSDHL